jgi:hypothetical protein
VHYECWAYHEVNGQRVYAGFCLARVTYISGNGAAVVWAGGALPAWVQGLTVGRVYNGILDAWRDVNAATLLAGWTDDGTGWTAGLPWSFAAPMTAVKVMWCGQYWGEPEVMATAPSLFGGAAFDSTANGKVLVRLMSDDLRRLRNGTLAMWVQPAFETSGVLHSVRGSAAGNYGGNYTADTVFTVAGTSGDATLTGHVDGDWYLLVQRYDELEDFCRVELWRERDLAHAVFTEAWSVGPLDAESDYILEGIHGALALGSSWHYGVPGYARYDRLGLWNRALTDGEVLELFNGGLGWTPN